MCKWIRTLRCFVKINRVVFRVWPAVHGKDSAGGGRKESEWSGFKHFTLPSIPCTEPTAYLTFFIEPHPWRRRQGEETMLRCFFFYGPICIVGEWGRGGGHAHLPSTCGRGPAPASRPAGRWRRWGPLRSWDRLEVEEHEQGWSRPVGVCMCVCV